VRRQGAAAVAQDRIAQGGARASALIATGRGPLLPRSGPSPNSGAQGLRRYRYGSRALSRGLGPSPDSGGARASALIAAGRRPSPAGWVPPQTRVTSACRTANVRQRLGIDLPLTLGQRVPLPARGRGPAPLRSDDSSLRGEGAQHCYVRGLVVYWSAQRGQVDHGPVAWLQFDLGGLAFAAGGQGYVVGAGGEGQAGEGDSSG
jgi:hypothetical protein